MRLILAKTRSFCAGVDRAVAIVEAVLDLYGGPIFVRHEIVHNATVIERLRLAGAVFVEEIDEIPEGATLILSAHGSPPRIRKEAEARRMRLFDATCPLVTKVHLEVARHAKAGRTLVVIGHAGHVEVQGILGWFEPASGAGAFVVESEADAWTIQPAEPENIGCVTQTTLATDQTERIMDVLLTRFPKLVRPHSQDICYATQNRQENVRQLARTCGLILILGAPNSSNSLRLVEVAERCGAVARLIERPDEIQAEWLADHSAVGLTASASAPEHLVQRSVARIRTLVQDLSVEEQGEVETASFRLPADLGRQHFARTPLAAEPVPDPGAAARLYGLPFP